MIARAPHLRELRASAVLGVSLALLACGRPTPPRRRARADQRPPPPARAQQPAARCRSTACRDRATPQRAVRGARGIDVAAGTLRAGQSDGLADRNPEREADDVAMSMPAFAIDALPYPNDPAHPRSPSVNRSEAAKLCAERRQAPVQRARVGTCLQGRRAARVSGALAGKERGSLAGCTAGRCASEPLACASPSACSRWGRGAREWTASEARGGLGDPLRKAVVRGADCRGAEPRLHRCAARDAATPDSKSESLAFRCCRGPQPDARPTRASPSAPLSRRRRSVQRAAGGARVDARDTRALPTSSGRSRSDERTRALIKASQSRSSMAPWIAAEKPLCLVARARRRGAGARRRHAARRAAGRLLPAAGRRARVRWQRADQERALGHLARLQARRARRSCCSAPAGAAAARAVRSRSATTDAFTSCSDRSEAAASSSTARYVRWAA